MHQLLQSLPPGARVLDLGARTGSFQSARRDLSIVRLDLEIPATRAAGLYAAGDAARMPFADAAFDLIVSNHSLEHFVELEATVREIGRVLRPGGALFVTVPDATTVTDRIYRWIGRGGGHVNAFCSPDDVIGVVERLAGIRHRATRPLVSGMSFLNRHSFSGRAPRKLALFGFGSERFLAVGMWGLRSIDRAMGTRLSHYGWAFYFGNWPELPSDEVWVNVCVRCGAGHPARKLPGTLSYRCPQCDGWNLRS
jgi:SAM-dependent methyltransferase